MLGLRGLSRGLPRRCGKHWLASRDARYGGRRRPCWPGWDSCLDWVTYLNFRGFVLRVSLPLHGLTLVVILLGLSSQWPACSSSL